MIPMIRVATRLVAVLVMIGFALSHLVGSATAESKPPERPPGESTLPQGKTDPGNGTKPGSLPPPTGTITGYSHCTTTPVICLPSLTGGSNCTGGTTTCP
jgi:hypothetical protein